MSFQPLRVASGGKDGLRYYKDTSSERKLPCTAHGCLSVRSSLLVAQFGDILKSVELPFFWQQVISERCKTASGEDDTESERVERRRKEIEAEQERLVILFTMGYITVKKLDDQMKVLRKELFDLPSPKVQNTEHIIEEALKAGETLGCMIDYGMRQYQKKGGI